MQEELLNALKALPVDQLQAILQLAQRELTDRTPSEPSPHYVACSEEREIPDEIWQELRDLNDDIGNDETIHITVSVELEANIECTGNSGDPDDDMMVTFNMYDEPEVEDVLRDCAEFKEAYNEMHGRLLKLRKRAAEVAKQYGKDVEDIMNDL